MKIVIETVYKIKLRTPITPFLFLREASVDIQLHWQKGVGGVMVGFGLCVGKNCFPLFQFVFIVFKIAGFTLSYRSNIFPIPLHHHFCPCVRLVSMRLFGHTFPTSCNAHYRKLGAEIRSIFCVQSFLDFSLNIQRTESVFNLFAHKFIKNLLIHSFFFRRHITKAIHKILFG